MRKRRPPELPTLVEALTPRELEAVDWCARGFANCEIAQRMSITERTVKNYLYRATQLLGLCGRYELILVALDQGRVDLAARLAEIAERRARWADGGCGRD